MEKTEMMERYGAATGKSDGIIEGDRKDCIQHDYSKWPEGCEYCNPPSVGKDEVKIMFEGSFEYLGDEGMNDFNLSIYVSPNHPNIIVRENNDNLSDSKFIPINYCPMCGRKLEEKQ